MNEKQNYIIMIIRNDFSQIGNKFRDENARYGLLRSREFLMKDLYTFDVDQESAIKTYEEVNEVYRKLFQFIGVPFIEGNQI